DFHVDPVQLVEAKAIGASAVLLIARALSPDDLRAMVSRAAELELEVLLEVRDEDELSLALDLGAPLIGINNRNLETLVIAAYAGVIFAGGPRHRTRAEAVAVFDAAGSRVKRVGVFANQSAVEILRAARALSLDVVQLHSDVSDSRIREIQAGFDGDVWPVV